jgi:hypothetical protein
MSFAAIILYVASDRVFIVVSVYLFIDTVQKRLDTPLYLLVLSLIQMRLHYK